MENGNFVYKGWKCNGFLALVLILGGLALGVYAIVAGAQRIDAGLALGGGLVAAGRLVPLHADLHGGIHAARTQRGARDGLFR